MEGMAGDSWKEGGFGKAGEEEKSTCADDLPLVSYLTATPSDCTTLLQDRQISPSVYTRGWSTLTSSPTYLCPGLVP